MIEEAAGTRMYESKRSSAQKTIEKKDTKLREIEVVRVHQPHPSALPHPLCVVYMLCSPCCLDSRRGDITDSQETEGGVF